MTSHVSIICFSGYKIALLDLEEKVIELQDRHYVSFVAKFYYKYDSMESCSDGQRFVIISIW